MSIDLVCLFYRCKPTVNRYKKALHQLNVAIIIIILW